MAIRDNVTFLRLLSAVAPLCVTIGCAAGQQPAEAAGNTELISRLRAEVSAEVDLGFSGVVLITRGDETVLEQAAGLADRDRGTPNRPTTRFNLGSGDKLFTTIAIAQLLSAGHVSLRDTVGRFLPDYPDETVRRKMTIQHLIEHTSGLGSHLENAIAARARRLTSLQDLLPLFAHEPPAFEPGTSSRYSNSGFVLLGRIIEVVMSTTYYDYVRTHIFAPAGMTATEYLAIDNWPEDRATGYTPSAPRPDGRSSGDSPRLRPNTDLLPYKGSSAGGGFSTAHDLARLDRAMRAGRILPAEHSQNLFMRSRDGRRVLLANGGTNGASFEFRRIGDYTVITLANLDPPAAARLTDRIARILIQVQRLS